MESIFRAVSISYKTAPLSIREQISLSESSCKQLLLQLKDCTLAQDLLILSTCNRTEVYYTATEDFSGIIIKLLGLQQGVADQAEFKGYFDIINNPDVAIRHLYSVSLGLDSQVVGDVQIINQVKHAYQWSADLGLPGPYLHRLLHTIFYANKRVVQETGFRTGAASISYAAIELLDELTTEALNPKILVLGLGEIGKDVARNLASTRFKNVTVTNRTLSKAEAIASECNFSIAPLDNVWAQIESADVIISSVQLDAPYITKEKVSNLNFYKYKYFIDLSVPRSVESSIELIPGALVYNIDMLSTRATAALKARIAEIPKVEAIIEASVHDFLDWTRDAIVNPTINKIKDALETIRQEELSRHLRNLSDHENKLVDKVTKAMMQKIVKTHVLQLKAACKRGDAESLIDTLNSLFDLEPETEAKA